MGYLDMFLLLFRPSRFRRLCRLLVSIRAPSLNPHRISLVILTDRERACRASGSGRIPTIFRPPMPHQGVLSTTCPDLFPAFVCFPHALLLLIRCKQLDPRPAAFITW